MMSLRLQICIIGLIFAALLSSCVQSTLTTTETLPTNTLPHPTGTKVLPTVVSPSPAVTEKVLEVPVESSTETPFPIATPTPILAFSAHPLTKDFKAAHAVDLTDLDNDGDIDIVGAGWTAGSIRWWQNDGDGNFMEYIVTEDFPGARYIFAFDLDQDGDNDLLGAAQEAEAGLMWWENDGMGEFIPHAVVERYKGVSTVDAADFDGDGDLDIISGTSTFNELVWWENDGKANFSKHDIPQGALVWISYVDAVDLDGDERTDILGIGYTSDTMVWLRNDGHGDFSEHIIDRDYAGGHTVRASDLDLDGDQDIIGAAHRAGEFTWWRNNGTGYFEKITVSDDIPGAIYIDAGDIDGDQDIDLIGAAEVSWLVMWLENDGTQNYTRHDISTSFAGSSCVRSADLDSDGDLDIVGTGVGGNGSVFWWENLMASNPTTQLPSLDTSKVSFEEVNFTTDDHAALNATLFGGEGDMAVLLLHMGKAKSSNNTQKDWHSFARFIADQDFPALTIDFRGRGSSGGEFGNDLLPLDVLAALQFLKDRGYQRFICVGAGMGGTTCMRLALDGIEFEGLVILSTSLEAGYTNKISTSEIPRIDIPKLYIYAENDGFGFSDAMEKIYAVSSQPKDLYICSDSAAHGTELLNVACGEELHQWILRFLKELR